MRTLLRTLAMLTVLASIIPAQQTLAALSGRDRVLLVFAPDALDRRFGQQLDNLAQHTAELGKRDVVLIPIVPDSGLPNASPVLRELRPPLVHDDEKLTFRRRFHIDPASFAVILLDKSGSERLRSSAPITIQRINRTIDALPAHK